MHIFDIIVYSIIIAHLGFFLYSILEIKKGDEYECKTLKLVAFISFLFLVLLSSVFIVLPVSIG
jgi:hypothetical protein